MRRFVLISFDGILVYSGDWESHMEHLATVIFILQENQIYAKYTKCEFGLMKIEYLGHTVLVEGVRMEESKIEAILK